MIIGDRSIGADSPVFVVAEIGVNHNGSVERALELIDHAKACGADAVKLQIFRAETLIHRTATFAEYQKDRVDAPDPAAMLRQYELSDQSIATIRQAADAAGLLLVSTPFSPSDVPRAAAVSAAIKIASPDLVNRVLLSRSIEAGRPLIVSTGAASAEEIERAACWLKLQHADFAFLHCISSYPVPQEEANLNWITDLSVYGVPVGYSDHTTDVLAGALAVACGARIIEKHLTYDPDAEGPDHSASFDPPMFAEYVRRIRQAERMVGQRGRRVLDCEEDVRLVSRQSLVITKALPAGHVIQAEDLTTQRPGTGISAEKVDQIIGRAVVRDLRAGEMLQPQDFGDAS